MNDRESVKRTLFYAGAVLFAAVLVTANPCKANAADRIAKVRIKNNTGRDVNFMVQHQYTGKKEQTSEWIEIKDGEEKDVMTVNYRAGFGTTGVDNWIVSGKVRSKVGANFKLPDALVKAGVKVGADGYLEVVFHSESGVLARWKKHTLRAEDEKEATVILVSPKIVKFQSKSGESETDWVPEWDIIPKLIK